MVCSRGTANVRASDRSLDLGLDSYHAFCEAYRELTGFDLTGYKRGQIERRLQSLCVKWQLDSLGQLAETVRTDLQRRDEVRERLTIHVSEFARNGERWSRLPQVLQDARGARAQDPVSLRCWSAGCSSGQEPYTLLITLAAVLPEWSVDVLCTDIDGGILALAQQGVYTAADIASLSETARMRYFEATADGRSRVVPQLRERALFEQHDLLSDPYPAGFDLILCRNVVIYFTEDAKRSVYAGLAASLSAQGILFVGSTEQIARPQEHGLEQIEPFFYARKAGG